LCRPGYGSDGMGKEPWRERPRVGATNASRAHTGVVHATVPAVGEGATIRGTVSPENAGPALRLFFMTNRTSDGPLDVGDRAYQREREGLGNETDLNPARSAVRGRDPVHVEPDQPSRSRTTRTTGAASSYLTASFEDITRARIAVTNYHDFKRREWIEISAGGCSVHGMTGGALTSPAYGVGVLPARQNGTERSYRSISKRGAICSHAPIRTAMASDSPNIS
jgi:hypothetical protein